MGFFDFLKKPQEKQETAVVKTLTLPEIEIFLDKKAEEINAKLGGNLEQLKKEIKEELEKLKHNLVVLENAELKNKELPERAKQIMRGNRQIYLQKTRSLIEKIIFPERPHELLSFAKNFDRELDLFDKGISKSHRIMEEFFVEKASVIAASIKNIDKLFKEIRQSIEKSGLSKIEELKKKSSEVIEKINKTAEGKNKLIQIEKEIEIQEQEVKQKEAGLKKVQQEDSYKQALSLLNSKEELEKEIQQLSFRIRYSFSEIEPALKKYENLSENKLAKKYLEEPVAALLEDHELEILKILDAIQKAVIKGEIILKDKKKDRAMNEIFNLNADFFKDILTQRKQLTAALSEKTAQIENSQILKDFAELEKSLNQNKAILQEKISEFEKMKKDIETASISELTKSLEKDFKEKLGSDVKIL